MFRCASQAIALSAAKSSKLELSVQSLQQDLEHLDAENEQLKNECRQLEKEREGRSSILAHLAIEQRKTADAVESARCITQDLAAVSEHIFILIERQTLQHEQMHRERQEWDRDRADLIAQMQALRDKLEQTQGSESAAQKSHEQMRALNASQLSRMHELEQMVESSASREEKISKEMTACRALVAGAEAAMRNLRAASKELAADVSTAISEAEAGAIGASFLQRHLEHVETELCNVRLSCHNLQQDIEREKGERQLEISTWRGQREGIMNERERERQEWDRDRSDLMKQVDDVNKRAEQARQTSINEMRGERAALEKEREMEREVWNKELQSRQNEWQRVKEAMESKSGRERAELSQELKEEKRKSASLRTVMEVLVQHTT